MGYDRETCETPNYEVEELRAEVAKWKRLYETVVVRKEGMELYAEIERLKAEVKRLEKAAIWCGDDRVR